MIVKSRKSLSDIINNNHGGHVCFYLFFRYSLVEFLTKTNTRLCFQVFVVLFSHKNNRLFFFFCMSLSVLNKSPNVITAIFQ